MKSVRTIHAIIAAGLASALIFTAVGAVAVDAAAADTAGAETTFPSPPHLTPPAARSSRIPVPQPFIVGGYRASLSEAPYIAEVIDVAGGDCTGVQVAPTWVLTAKHCMANLRTMSVYLGSAERGQGSRYSIAHSHDWSGGDLALLELAEPHIGRAATLGHGPIVRNTKGQIYGFGFSAPGQSSPFLKGAHVTYIGDSRDTFGAAAYEVKGDDGQSYSGDSGGPLVIKGKVLGINSTGHSRGVDIHATAQYTKISDASAWIRRTSGVVVR